MRSLTIVLLAGLLTLLAALPLTAKVLLHADYARSEPAADEVLAVPPTQVKVWFTQELFRREGENFLHVTGPDGARVDVGEAVVDDDDRRLLTVALAGDLPEGTYRVEWRALSADDGHAKEDEFVFVVGDASPPAQESPAQQTPAQQTPAQQTSVPEAPAATQPPVDTPAAQPTLAPDTGPTPSSAPSRGLPCLGASPLLLMAVGAVLARKRRTN
ncbi:MAG: copper resistance protein CopC [Caldilineaceae bacterium]|nr:copper resistance protein CopC [Caldilineaceae bacterium]